MSPQVMHTSTRLARFSSALSTRWQMYWYCCKKLLA